MRRKKSSSSSQMDNAKGGGSELFICFTSRPSSSSATPSLSASLSRRLSVKGTQSPMFAGRRSKGAAFETAEPTSPKVTCIGQVRVKGKQRRKKAKGAMLRSRSKRVVGTEASFRREGERECMPGGKNQGWVYQIPVSICDALKAVGSEFNCLLPCSGRSFCSSSSSGKGTGEEGKVKRRGSCGSVLARWLMMEENERKRGVLEEELEVVEMERKVEVVTSWEDRRMVEEFEEVEIVKKDEILFVEEEKEDDDEEKGRVSVCIPPKNALLLMRCRSDPVRMAALANRLWGSPVRKVHAQEEEVEEREDEGDEEREERERECDVGEKVAIVGENEGERVYEEASVSEEAERADLKEMETEVCENDKVEIEEKEDLDEPKEEFLEKIEDQQCPNETEEEKDCNFMEPQNVDPLELTKEETIEKTQMVKEENEIKLRRSTSCSPSTKEEKKVRHYKMRRQRSNGGSSSRDKESRRHSFSSEGDPRRSSFSSVKDGRRSSFSIEGRRWSFSIEQDEIIIDKKTEHPKGSKLDEKTGVLNATEKREEKAEEKTERKLEVIASERKKSGELPDCLLLMMYEPKLSMEVSRETWVRPTDFINWRAHNKRQNPPPKENPKTEDPKVDTPKVTEKKETADPLPPVVIEEKVKVEMPVLYAPFVLKRCKSEPMRASARIVADACFWKERHRPIGAVGF